MFKDPFFFSIFLSPRLSFTYSTFHQQVVSVYVGTGGLNGTAKLPGPPARNVMSRKTVTPTRSSATPTRSSATLCSAIVLNPRSPRRKELGASKSEHWRTGVLKLGIEHELSECRRGPLKLRGSKCEQSDYVSLCLCRKRVEVLLNHIISLFARQSLETGIDNSDANSRGVVAV